MIDIKLTRLINSVPVGYLTSKLWITKGGKVLPVELNEFADYALKPNPKPETITLSVNDYERMTREYFATLPTVDERQLKPIAKHMAGKHDQSTHGRKKSVSFDTSGYESLVGQSSEDFQAAMSGLGISEEVASGSQARFAFRSMPAPEEMESNFVSLDKDLKALTDKNPISIMTEEDVLDSILDDGKVKSIFELDDEWKGEQYREHRTAYEKVAFGYDATTPPEIRPVSGIVYPSEMNDKLIDTFGNNYGSVQLVLKDDVKSRTTVTIGDSLDKWQRPTPIGGQVPRTFDLATMAQSSVKFSGRGENALTKETFWGFTYVEAQVHGGVKLSDIDKIVIHYPQWIDMEATTNRLNEMGIAWEVVQ
jgi:hypothetical protein